MPITPKQKETIIELYSAYFNRAADADGANFWSNSFEEYFVNSPTSFSEPNKEQFALLKISKDISTAIEYTNLYPSTLGNIGFITTIYSNLLKRIPDTDGRDFWVNHLEQGTMERGEAIMRMIEGAKSNTTEQGLLDASLISNKSIISLYFVDPLQSNDLELAKTILSTITSDFATVEAAKVLLDTTLGIIPISETSLPIPEESDDSPTSTPTSTPTPTPTSTSTSTPTSTPTPTPTLTTKEGTDGSEDNFIYKIDSSNFIIESKETGDTLLKNFNINEDKLTFDDVSNGTTSTALFLKDSLITSSATETKISFDVPIINNDNIVIAETGVSLTLQGVSDFSAVDFSVI